MVEPTSTKPPVMPVAVLLVDDERPLIELFAEVLSSEFHCDLATSTKQAGEMMQKKKYRVVISDFSMPGGDGLSFLIKVRKQYPDTARILVTHYLSPEFMTRLDAAAPEHYLLKPVSIPDLRKAVRDAARPHDRAETAS